MITYVLQSTMYSFVDWAQESVTNVYLLLPKQTPSKLLAEEMSFGTSNAEETVSYVSVTPNKSP